MTKCTFYFAGVDRPTVITAEEFHEDGEFLKAYEGPELVGIFRIDSVIAAYRTEVRE